MTGQVLASERKNYHVSVRVRLAPDRVNARVRRGCPIIHNFLRCVTASPGSARFHNSGSAK